MITRIVKLHVQPDKAGMFTEAFQRVQARILTSPGCQSVQLHQDLDHPDVYFTISTWDQPGDLEAYRQSTTFKEVWPEVKAWFASPAQAWTLQNIPA